MAGLMMEKRYFLFIPVSWVLVMLGGIEAVWGLRQLYGYAVSNHSLYVLTGSFFNPGPYSGYLAMILPVCLYQWLTKRGEILCSDRNDGKGWKKVMDKAGVQALASIPSREELLSKLLYVMQAPVAGFVRGLAALATQREEAAA